MKLLFSPRRQKYNQVNDNFLKSDHPAVARTKPRLSSPFPIANPAFGSPTAVTAPFPRDPLSQSPSPGAFRQEADAQEVVPSYNEYIIPIPDPKPEEVFTDVPSESPARYRDAAAPRPGMYLLNKGGVSPKAHPLTQMWSRDNSCIVKTCFNSILKPAAKPNWFKKPNKYLTVKNPDIFTPIIASGSPS